MFNNSNGYSLSDIAAATGNNSNNGFGFNGEFGHSGMDDCIGAAFLKPLEVGG